jgi:ribosomal protein L37AE/L43A
MSPVGGLSFAQHVNAATQPPLPLKPGVYRCPRCRREAELFVAASSVRCDPCGRTMLNIEPLPLAFARTAFARQATAAKGRPGSLGR